MSEIQSTLQLPGRLVLALQRTAKFQVFEDDFEPEDKEDAFEETEDKFEESGSSAPLQ